MKKIRIIIILCSIALSLNSQVNTDSLWKIWNDTTQTDKLRFRALDDLAWDARYKNTDSSMILANLGLDYAKLKNLKPQQANACNMLGVAYYIKSNYGKAIYWHKQSLAIREEMDNKPGMAVSYNNLGNIYSEQSDYFKALESYQKALDLIESSNKKSAAIYNSNIGSIYLYQGIHTKALQQFQTALSLSEELSDKNGMAVAYNNIGLIYDNVGDTTKSLEYYRKSVDLNKESGNKHGLAESYNNIGNIKKAQGDFTQALDYLQKSLALEKELDNRQGIAGIYNDIGEIYSAQDNVPLSHENFRKGLALAEELGNRDKTVYSYIGIGNLHLREKKFGRAEILGKKALKLSEELGIVTFQRNASKLLYEIYKALGKNTDALSYHEKFLDLTDSIKTTETNKKLDQMEFARILFADSLKKEKEKFMVKKAHEEQVYRKDMQRNLAIYIGAGVLLVAATLWSRLRYVRKTRAIIQKEKDRSENLLLNILPAQITEELKIRGKTEARDFDMVSILFTDFKEFTTMSEKMNAKELVAEINYFFEAFDLIVNKYNIEKIKTIGDSYMAAGGLPVPTPGSVKNTVLAALEMQSFVQAYRLQKEAEGKPAFQMRVGIHTGPVVAGIVGVKKFQYDIWGDAVNTASRMESSGAVGQVNISHSTYELIKDEPLFHFQSRGKIVAKGKGEVLMYFVTLQDQE